MNYQVLVNKENPYQLEPNTSISFVYFLDAFQRPCLLEEKTYENFMKMKAYVLENETINIGVEEGYRSFQEQELKFLELKEEYGEDYARKYVAKVGTSEHHTGLAIDMTIEVDGTYLNDNYKMEENEHLYKRIYPYLSQFGFVLRFPKGKESITGYPNEVWHIRYVGKEFAQELDKNNLILEEYLQKNIS